MSDKVNFCIAGIMSTCRAENTKEQKKCKFYEKASYENRCMYFIFDEYCDCLKAQDDLKHPDQTTKLQEKNQKKIDEKTTTETSYIKGRRKLLTT